jgi:hypothetical protein
MDVPRTHIKLAVSAQRAQADVHPRHDRGAGKPTGEMMHRSHGVHGQVTRFPARFSFID